jgi:peptide/nickel transport system ATP-binding protein
MYAGRAVEMGTATDVFGQPGHPYAWGLLDSMPRLNVARIDRLRPIPGTPPSLINVPAGCPFHPRCAYPAEVGGDRCRTEVPALLEIGPGHRTACHLTVAKRQEIWARLAPPEPPSEPDAPESTEEAAAEVTEVEAP